jgi:hypothetical protein
MRRAIFSFVLAHLCALAALPQTGGFQKHPYKGPACIADFCLAKAPLPSEEELIQAHGPGTQIGEYRCYAVPEQKAYVHFHVEPHRSGEIVTVFVSRAPNCVDPSGKVANATKPFPALETKEGIQLGDAAEKVLALYGPPSSKRGGADGRGSMVPYSREREGSPFGETVLVYDGPPPQLIQAKFFIHHRKVIAMYLSCSE